MRKFTILEKELIGNMISCKMFLDQNVIRTNVFLCEYYIGPEHDISITFPKDSEQVIISYPKSDAENVYPLTLFVTFLKLLQYLESQGVVIWIDEPEGKTQGKALGKQFPNGHNVALSPGLATIAALTFENTFVVTQDLINLVNNSFRETDEIRHRQTLFYSACALFVAILLGLWGIFRDVFQGKNPCLCKIEDASLIKAKDNPAKTDLNSQKKSRTISSTYGSSRMCVFLWRGHRYVGTVYFGDQPVTAPCRYCS